MNDRTNQPRHATRPTHLLSCAQHSSAAERAVTRTRSRLEHRRTPVRLTTSGAIALLLMACGPAQPAAQHASKTDVTKLTTLEDVMELQEAIAEPQFKKSDKASYDETDWQAFTDASARLQQTSLKIKDFTRSPEFDAFAMQLHSHAIELGRAASAKDAPATSRTLKAMHATCDGCHAKFR